MQSSASSALHKENGPSIKISFAIWTLRIVLGAVFMFSGFVKAVDVWGTFYKVSEYYSSWGVSMGTEFILIQAFILSGFEFVLGSAILVGAFRNVTRWLALVFMSVMTLITFYILIEDPVADCGCFGDALILSNSMTFVKNVVLLLIVILYFKFNKRIEGLFGSKACWIVLPLTVAYILAVQIYGYMVQPLIDFRPFSVGTSLRETDEDESVDMIKFVYEKDGLKKIFTADNIPDDSWQFIERIDDNSKDTDAGRIVIFDGEDEVTDDVVENDGYEFLLIVNDAGHYGVSRSEMANRLYEYAEKHDCNMFAIVAGTPENAQEWADLVEAQYPVYSADDTELKMLVRGEAGLVVLKDGKVEYKTNIYALSPDFPDLTVTPDTLFAEKEENRLAQFTFIWLAAVFIVYVVTRYPRIQLKRRKAKP